MPDYPSKRKWDKENTVLIAIKFQKKTDQDVIDFLEGKNKRDTVLAALREYMANHPNAKPFCDTTITTPAKGEKGQGEK